MGSSSLPINASSATLILASGTVAGQYGLIVNPGGNFTVYGTVKASTAGLTTDANAGDASISVATTGLGWLPGDTITVDAEEVTINTLNSTTINFGSGQTLGQAHSSMTAIVANLTRNVVVRSSGTLVPTTTNTGKNTAFIRNLATNTTSFSLAYGEFAYLGAVSAASPFENGISFDGAGVKGSISSCTIHNMYDGFYANQASGNTISNNVIYIQNDNGMDFETTTNNQITANQVYANASGQQNALLLTAGSNNTVSNNVVFSNASDGIVIYTGESNDIVSGNRSFGNSFTGGGNGIFVSGSNNCTITSNTLYNNNGAGVDLVSGSNITVSSNVIYANNNQGIGFADGVNSNNDNLYANTIYSNVLGGISLSAGSDFNQVNANVLTANGGSSAAGISVLGSSNTVLGNLVSGSAAEGIYIGAPDNLVVSNWVNSGNGNSGPGGISLSADNNLLINNYSYGNLTYGVYSAGAGNLWAGGGIGYSSSSVATADTTAEIFFKNAANNLTLKGALVNAVPGISTTNVTSGRYILSYNQNYATGTVRVYGDYSVSGSTFTLDYSTNTYASSYSTPKDMSSGDGNTITALATSDANTLTEYITVTATNSATSSWSVSGSSSGFIGGISCAPSGHCAFSSSKMNFTLNPGTAFGNGDFLDFVTIAASSDSAKAKSLLFGPADSSYNHGRSKIKVAPGAGFHAIGVSTAPSVITEMISGGTYYTFVDSGAFTVQYASFTDMDEMGIQLSSAGASGPWSINYSTFDYPGSGVGSTSTLITLNGITNSAITLVGVTYSSSTRNTHTYNYNIIGSSTGLSWTNQQYTGTLVGAANTEDDATQQHILWEPVGCSTITSITNGNWSSSNTWDSGFVPTACNPVYVISGTTVALDINNAIASTITITGQLSFKRSGDNELMQTGGNLYVNVGGTLDMGTSGSPILQGTTAYLILSSGTTAGQYGLIVRNGGNFLVYGAAKTPWTTVPSGTVGKGVTGFQVADGTGWQVGDNITIDTEAVKILSISRDNSGDHQ